MRWIDIFGEGTDLTVLQMTVRGIVIFLFALVILKIAGTKTFGQKSVADNIIMIMIGAILSRAVVGASPFWPVIASSTGIVLVHRFFAWICIYNKSFEKLLKGTPEALYKNGSLNKASMKECLFTDKDIMEGVRLKANTNSLDDVEEVLLEVSGELSVVEKKK